MLYGIVLLFCLLLSLLMEQAARQGRAVPVAIATKSNALDGVCYFRPHLIEETPSALLEAEAFAYSYILQNHIDVQCDVVLEVICFSKADYNAKISKSQEPSALFISMRLEYQMSIHALEAGLFFECIYRQLMSVMRLVYRYTPVYMQA